MRSKSAVVLILLISPALIGATPPARTYLIPLTGQAEVGEMPGLEGDRDGSGRVRLTVDPAGRQICYDFALSGLATPPMAHVHKGKALHNGPSVVTLFTGPGGDLSDCVVRREDRLAEIVSNPSNFYVNLYTTEFPDGAVRGQLAG